VTDDHLDKEKSISVELTERGLKASSNLRSINAFERLLGNLPELLNVKLERYISRERATIDGEKAVIDTAAAYVVDRIGRDNEFAARVFQNGFRLDAQRQLNKDGVVGAALQDLTASPPSEQEANSGPASLTPEFMDRLERYAEEATTEDLRARWGRILASEIRRPGTFSSRVLRITDEIDAETALMFEKVCVNRFNDMLLRPLMGELPFDLKNRLQEAELITDPGITGQVMLFSQANMDDGRPIWVAEFGDTAFAFDKSKTVSGDPSMPLTMHEGQLGIPIYVLTSAGQALGTILEDHTAQAVENLRLVIKATRLNW
jgi:hypothetical protein